MTNPDIAHWPSPQEIKRRKSTGETMHKMAKELNISSDTLRRYCEGLPIRGPQIPDTEDAIRDALERADARFVALMQAAIQSGTESPEVGIKVDHSSWHNARRFRPAMVFSGCGSPASMCADTAEIERTAEIVYA